MRDKGPISFQKHHSGHSKSCWSGCSFVYGFMAVWILTMMLGSLYFIRSINQGNVDSGTEPITEVLQSIDESRLRNIKQDKNILLPSFSQGEVQGHSFPEFSGNFRKELKKQAVLDTIRNNALSTKTVVMTRNISAILNKPIDQLKGRDMFVLTHIEQRQFLQSLNADKPAPSTKAADAFIKYTEDAAAGAR